MDDKSKYAGVKRYSTHSQYLFYEYNKDGQLHMQWQREKETDFLRRLIRYGTTFREFFALEKNSQGKIMSIRQRVIYEDKNFEREMGKYYTRIIMDDNDVLLKYSDNIGNEWNRDWGISFPFDHKVPLRYFLDKQYAQLHNLTVSYEKGYTNYNRTISKIGGTVPERRASPSQ